ncbi:ATP-binding protein [Nonomuraea wenchangensis]|uniref:sensor histidine kinase n=1 Tax=Nonomuraea wenchangensis TaxID=568860 RepID=UPI00341EDEAB
MRRSRCSTWASAICCARCGSPSGPSQSRESYRRRQIGNLVENAIRHNHPGGEVWVTTRPRAGQVELVVANTGLQVPSYEIEAIFQPFRRLHADRGSGLGLSIVQVIDTARAGTVVARPREEGGLTITVELPAS